MLVRLAILLWSVLFPEPYVSLKFKDISVSQTLKAGIDLQPKLAAVPVPEWLRFGRIKTLEIMVSTEWITLYVNGISIQGDPIRWVRGIYHRKLELYYLKAEALGGLIELVGNIPK
jgi:hypothetical protein